MIGQLSAITSELYINFSNTSFLIKIKLMKNILRWKCGSVYDHVGSVPILLITQDTVASKWQKNKHFL